MYQSQGKPTPLFSPQHRQSKGLVFSPNQRILEQENHLGLLSPVIGATKSTRRKRKLRHHFVSQFSYSKVDVESQMKICK